MLFDGPSEESVLELQSTVPTSETPSAVESFATIAPVATQGDIAPAESHDSAPSNRAGGTSDVVGEHPTRQENAKTPEPALEPLAVTNVVNPQAPARIFAAAYAGVADVRGSRRLSPTEFGLPAGTTIDSCTASDPKITCSVTGNGTALLVCTGITPYTATATYSITVPIATTDTLTVNVNCLVGSGGAGVIVAPIDPP